MSYTFSPIATFSEQFKEHIGEPSVVLLDDTSAKGISWLGFHSKRMMRLRRSVEFLCLTMEWWSSTSIILDLRCMGSLEGLERGAELQEFAQGKHCLRT